MLLSVYEFGESRRRVTVFFLSAVRCTRALLKPCDILEVKCALQ